MSDLTSSSPAQLRKLRIDNGFLEQSIDGGATWTAIPSPAQGAALTGAASQTINPATDAASQYPLLTPLTQNAALTLGVAGSPITNSIVSVWRLGAGAFTYTVKDDAGTTLYTFPSGSTKQLANFYFDGTHYVFLSLVFTA